MRQKLFIFAFFLSVISYSQNWNVFNKAYRYNYKFDNSALISNVLFVETYSLSVTDTVYTMNTIGVVNGNTLTSNIPQFLMKKIIKEASGNVKLQDTTNITVIPTCTLNQSWVFDTNYNLTATCVSTSTQTIFSVIDSVKVIVINSVDSVVLSKQFGVIQFPKLYGQNKYYRLVGIENKATYDLTAQYGLKVPNAWDIYDFYIGYKWCYESSRNDGNNGPGSQACEIATQTIKTKSITASGYIYNIDKTFVAYNNSAYSCGNPAIIPTFTNVNLSFDASNFPGGLSSPSIRENKMYPGMVDVGQASGSAHIVKLGADNLGRVYKYSGKSCSSMGLTMPNQNEPSGYGKVGPFSSNIFTTPGMYYSLAFGVGMGKINDNADCLCSYRYCTTCYGTVGMLEFENNERPNLIYPNPANTKINLQSIPKGQIRIFNSLGKLVKEEIIENKSSLDIINLPSGLYFIEVQTDSFKETQKLIIQH